jgi:hypothetical protein
MTLRDKILAAAPAMPAEAAQFGDFDIEIRALTAAESAMFLKRVMTRDKGGDLQVDLGKWNVELVLASCYDPETGERLFQSEDAELVGRWPADVINEVARKAAALSGLGRERELAEALKSEPD